jgi:hypothetical protein
MYLVTFIMFFAMVTICVCEGEGGVRKLGVS